MTRYDHTFKGVEVIFEKEDLADTMGEVLEKQGLSQIRIAETEKYPHVTFFFSGGREKEFEGGRRIMKSSPKVATYDLQPEMSAPEVKDAIVEEIRNNPPDFICLNFANPDMVGHTGVFAAAVKACETVDACVGEVVDAALEQGYAILLTADHGNSDYLVNPDGSPNTAHTTNPVPVFYIDRDPAFKTIRDGKLGDVAPTLLRIMDIDIPDSMTGEILVQ
jgi:2,3-bisphosphoglycerate-independent phosphoglycerate mutase